MKKAIFDGSGQIPTDKASAYLVKMATSNPDQSNINVKISVDRPIVGIGAPAHVYVPLVRGSSVPR